MPQGTAQTWVPPEEGIHVILESSEQSDSTPQEFVLICSHTNCRAFNLLLTSTSKRERPFSAESQLPEQVPQHIPPTSSWELPGSRRC